MATGNGRGIIDGMKLLAPANKERRKEIVDVVSRLGLKGSQVDIGQIMTRIGDLDKINDISVLQWAALNIMTLGVPALESTKIPLKMFGAKKDIEIGKPIAKYAQKAYVATDDIGKIASFLRERKRSQDIWNARPDTEKDLLRKQFSDEFGIDQAVKDFDTKLLDEDAVKKVMNIVPVYSRIPKILEKMRGIPILGSFTAFPAENLRNKYNLFKLAVN